MRGFDGPARHLLPPHERVPLRLERVQLAVEIGVSESIALPPGGQARHLAFVAGQVLADLRQLGLGGALAGARVGGRHGDEQAVGVEERLGDRLPHGQIHEVGAVVGGALAVGAVVARVPGPSARCPAALDIHAAVAGAAASQRPAQSLGLVSLADGDVATGVKGRLGGIPGVFVDDGRHGQRVVHALQLLVQLALVGGVSQHLADEGEVPSLAPRWRHALAVEHVGDALERHTLDAQVVDPPDHGCPLLVDAPALALAVHEAGRTGAAAGLTPAQGLDPSVRGLVADVPPLLAAHQALDRQRHLAPEVGRGVDAPRAVHHDEGVLAHESHQVRGVVEALLTDEAVELGDAHLVDRSSADQRLDHARPLGALG